MLTAAVRKRDCRSIENKPLPRKAPFIICTDCFGRRAAKVLQSGNNLCQRGQKSSSNLYCHRGTRERWESLIASLWRAERWQWVIACITASVSLCLPSCLTLEEQTLWECTLPKACSYEGFTCDADKAAELSLTSSIGVLVVGRRPLSGSRDSRLNWQPEPPDLSP